MLVAEVHVESGAADASAVEHILNRDLIELTFLQKRDQRIAEQISSAKNTAVGLRRALGRLIFDLSAFHDLRSWTDTYDLFGIVRSGQRSTCSIGASWLQWQHDR